MRIRSLCTTLLVVVLASIIGLSCEKTNLNSPYSDFYINLSVSDTAYPTTNQSGIYKPVEGTISITGDLDPHISIQLNWMDSVELNKPFDFSSGASISYTDNWTVGNYGTFVGNSTVGHGTIEVTWWNKTALILTGTFSGVLYNQNSIQPDSVVVTNGTFNVNYTQGS
jgi:hypothetical protein